jgi:SAM-dependent methyltransferase
VEIPAEISSPGAGARKIPNPGKSHRCLSRRVVIKASAKPALRKTKNLAHKKGLSGVAIEFSMKSPQEKPTIDQGEKLNIRERLTPRYRDELYMPLSDLRMAVQMVATREPIRILDYGAYHAPYASLFPNSDYRKADITESKGVDYLIAADSKIAEQDEFFDLVLSTQVAEHLPDPEKYFAEAWRLLKPDGVLLVTTHGIWEEHGVPHDYRRWTADGLKWDMEKAGFVVETVAKLTGSERFHLFQLLGMLLYGNLYRKGWSAKVLRKTKRWVGVLAAPVVNFLGDRLFPDCRLIRGEKIYEHRMYCGVALVCRKKKPEVVSLR